MPTHHERKLELLASQKNRCAICEKRVTLATAVLDRSIVGDHIRGVLCAKCKGLLDWSNDTPEFLQRVAEYQRGG